MNTKKDELKNWRLCGINLIPSDAIYQKINSIIESGDFSQLTEENLQKISGHRAPIYINRKNKVIEFARL